MTALSVAVVAQNLRRMVSRGQVREQQLPGGQTGYTTSAMEPGAAAASMGNSTVGTGGQVATASNATVKSP